MGERLTVVYAKPVVMVKLIEASSVTPANSMVRPASRSGSGQVYSAVTLIVHLIQPNVKVIAVL